jgi:excisionase family DNA binding protein
MNQKNQSNPDEILTVEKVAQILKVTPQTVYKLIKKGKIQKVEISTIDKPGVTPKIRVRRGEVEKYLEG